MKDAFDLWWEWAQKPHKSFLMIDADIHNPIMELSPEDRRDREKGQRSCASIPRKSEVNDQPPCDSETAAGAFWLVSSLTLPRAAKKESTTL
jgi:hypothetical protein